MSKQFFRLVHNDARRNAAEACMQAPDGYVVRIQEETRSLEQNAKLWPMLHDVSTQVIWYGQLLLEEEWKDIFTAALKKQKVVPGLNGEFVVCGHRTSTMPKGEFSDLIEVIYAFGTQQNVKWSEPAQRTYNELRAA